MTTSYTLHCPQCGRIIHLHRKRVDHSKPVVNCGDCLVRKGEIVTMEIMETKEQTKDE